MLKENTKAPDFSLLDQDGVSHTFSDYKGKWVVLYFYPKDDTPGCTKEACSFRDARHELESKGIVVLGVSKDTVKSHKKFVDKFNLNFTLLSDEEKKVIQAYEAWGKKKFMGREFDGVFRITYLINPDGTIAKGYEKVNVSKHATEILKDIDSYSS